MPTFTLEIEAYGLYLNDIPALEIWNEGVFQGSYNVTASGSTISINLNYTGSYPSSLEFRFNDAFTEAGRSIFFESIKINSRIVSAGNYLSAETLAKNESAFVSTSEAVFLFDQNEPDISLFSPLTATLTTANDDFLGIYITTDQIINALAGNDFIRLGSGNDKAYGDDGNDYIEGGAGEDILSGGNGVDNIKGGEGNDIIYGGLGDDDLFGQDGDDQIHGGDGDDKVIGHDGNDILTGGEGRDNILGGDGDDIIYGDAGNDTVIGDVGNDTIDGGAGNDALQGNLGDDVIYGGTGNDIIYGGDGNDVLHSGGDKNNVYGGNGNDIIYGGQGQNSLRGEDGNDTIYSRSIERLDATINNILSANSGVVYNGSTNSFYQYVGTGTTWLNADSISKGATLTGLSGVKGHLVTITTQEENNFVQGLSGTNSLWLSASDGAVEGQWAWTSGPEAGQHFWTEMLFGLGSAENSLYSNFSLLGLSSGQNHAYMMSNGLWDAAAATSTAHGYVIEWEASDLFKQVDETYIKAGTGADELYASDGIDVFTFEETDSVDHIYNFEAGGRDMLRIKDIISYDAPNDDLTDFVRLTESFLTGDTTLSVDTDGAANGENFTEIAVLHDVTGLDLAMMVAGDNLLVA